jgi:hypothetical protein
MTADQYTELVDFLGGQFERIDARFDAIDHRFDALEERAVRMEVGLESLRHDVQILGEGLSATNQRLDRYHEDHEIRIRALEERWFQH